MSILCPIEKISILGIEPIRLSGLIVVVGPNSSGKTQLLHDINETISGRGRKLVVADVVCFRQPQGSKTYLEYLVEKGYIEFSETKEKHQVFRKLRRNQAGTESMVSDNPLETRSFESFCSDFAGFAETQFEEVIPSHQFLLEIGNFLCSALFLDARLTLTNKVGNFDYLQLPATNTLQSFYLSEEGEEELLEETQRAFNRGVYIDTTRGSVICLKVSRSSEVPSDKDRRKPAAMKDQLGIEQAGDGIRAYVAICITLLSGDTPLYLIDEPEMCLHPPQAHAIGRFIGKYTIDETKCTFVATHSSHVLRGILEAQPQATIVRLTHTNLQFTACLISPDVLQEAIKKPRVRAETVLDGLFSDAVVLCESDGDRLVYEAAYRALKNTSLDIRFVARSGAGALADPLKLYQGLGVPTAIITDFDSLKNSGLVGQWLKGFDVEPSTVKSLAKQCRELITEITAEVSSISPEEVKIELKELAKEKWELPKDESKLRGRLTKLSKSVSSFSSLKENGIAGAPKEFQDDLRSLLNELCTHGLFIVPCGELESWIPKLMSGVAKDKNTWPNIAAEKIESIGRLESIENDEHDVWKFAERISTFLRKHLVRT